MDKSTPYIVGLELPLQPGGGGLLTLQSLLEQGSLTKFCGTAQEGPPGGHLARVREVAIKLQTEA